MNISNQYKFFIFISITLFSCWEADKQSMYKQEEVLIDSSYVDILKLFEHNQLNKAEYKTSFFPDFRSEYGATGKRTYSDSMIRHHYKLLFVGNETGYLPTEKFRDSLNYPLYFDHLRVLSRANYTESEFKQIPLPELLIKLDTTQFVKSKDKYYPRIDTGDEYPVYIINQSNLWSYFWTDSSFGLIMEAWHNENKRWQPIEYQTTHSGLHIVLPPHSYLITSAVVYDGNYPTKMRLKFFSNKKHLYSNEFYGKINKSQFDTISRKESLSVYHF